MKYHSHIENPDVILIGSGIMSANLGAMLKRLEPGLSIQVYEVTEELAQESSHGWNNAGTGHAGICELSYTPKQEADGSVNVQKLIDIFEQFEQSKQFWSHAVASATLVCGSTRCRSVRSQPAPPTAAASSCDTGTDRMAAAIASAATGTNRAR